MIAFIRHAQTVLDTKIPASQWQLSEKASAACQNLARGLQGLNLNCIVTSAEFKAKETGCMIADVLQKPCKEAANLHEHDRKNVSFMNAEMFQENIQSFFAKPEKLVFGQETANQALQRFDKAVKDVLKQHPEPIAIVTHASVLSLFIAHYNALNAYTFWQNLKMPDKVLTNSDFKFL